MGKSRAWIKEETLYPIIVLLLIWIMAVRLPLDTDMWWHLRAGEETWTSREVYQVDTFSYTREGAAWINHSWLSQVIMHLILRIGGFPGLSMWVGISAVVSMGLVYLQMQGPPLLRGVVLLLAAVVSSVVWSPRPQIITLVVLAVLSWMIFEFRRTRKKWILILIPLLFIAWGNLHGGYALGFIYLAAVLAGELFDQVLFRKQEDSLQKEELLLVVGTVVASALVVLINPFGFEIWKIPFNTVGVENLQNLINEWASPDFHQVYQQPMLWMLLLTVAILAISEKEIAGSDLLPVIIFTWAALTARRNFGPFAIVVAPVLCKHASGVLTKWLVDARGHLTWVNRFLQKAELNKTNFNPLARNIINCLLILLLLIAGVLKTVQVNQTDLFLEKEGEIFPAEAVKWLGELDQPIRLFNEYNWGGYLIYRIPEVPVFVDGRTDLFGDQILNEWADVKYGNGCWQSEIERRGISVILLQKDTSNISHFILDGWKIEHEDDLSIGLIRMD